MNIFKRALNRLRPQARIVHRAETVVFINGVRRVHQGTTTGVFTLVANVKRDGVYVACEGMQEVRLRAGETVTVMVGVAS